MILGLKRAVAHIIEAKLTDVHCYADEVANEFNHYPCIYITELNRKRGPLGSGRVDYVERELLPSRAVIKNGKIIEYRTALRFSIEASGNDIESAAEQVHRIDKDLDRLFIEVMHSKEQIRFIDHKNGENMNVIAVKFITATDIPVAVEQEPLLFRRASTYRFIHRLYLEEQVEHKIGHVKITNGGNNV